MNKETINQHARNLLADMWKNKERLWPNEQRTALQIISPADATRILGLEYLELPNLGDQRFSHRRGQYKVAGLLDRQANKIAVSTEYPTKVTRFTVAHEIGHFLMHPGKTMHRDLPLDGSQKNLGSRDITEKEADYFAACFLVPEKLLRYHFEIQFNGNSPFIFDEATSFHLNSNDPDSLLRADKKSLGREFALARCTSYNGKHFRSLSDLFKVSDSVMAIRIQELNLIRWP